MRRVERRLGAADQLRRRGRRPARPARRRSGSSSASGTQRQARPISAARCPVGHLAEQHRARPRPGDRPGRPAGTGGRRPGGCRRRASAGRTGPTATPRSRRRTGAGSRRRRWPGRPRPRSWGPVRGPARASPRRSPGSVATGSSSSSSEPPAQNTGGSAASTIGPGACLQRLVHGRCRSPGSWRSGARCGARLVEGEDRDAVGWMVEPDEAGPDRGRLTARGRCRRRPRAWCRSGRTRRASRRSRPPS